MKAISKFQSFLKFVMGMTITFLFIMITAHAALSAPAEGVDLYALLVGVGKYKDPKVRRVTTAQDVTQFHDFIVERRSLFRNVYVAFLRDTHATKANIVKALTKQLTKARKNDIVLIYMNSHGSLPASENARPFFITYDYDRSHPETRLYLSDKSLYKNIRSERLLFLSGSCFSGGFLTGLSRGGEMDFLGSLKGRFGMSSSRADEVSWGGGQWGMGVFGFYLIKGLRGASDVSGDGSISVKELYEYVAKNVENETKGRQHPQLFAATGNPEKTEIYKTPTTKEKLKIDVSFHYKADDGKVRTLTKDSALKSGQRVGVAFKADSDCYVHILWRDSNGNIGRLFPNPELTEGTGEVKAGKEYWLPSMEGKRWYVLDENPGIETIYFVASKERSEKLEKLYELLKSLDSKSQQGAKGRQVAMEIEREVNFMGFAKYTVPDKETKMASANKTEHFKKGKGELRIDSFDAFHKLVFKHVTGEKVEKAKKSDTAQPQKPGENQKPAESKKSEKSV
jgi:hypothetical protein